MRTHNILLLAALALFYISCTRTPDALGNTTTGSGNTGNISGNWRVTLFSERGEDETTDFAGFVFSFNTGGIVIATRNATSKTGSWSITANSTKFNIDLGPKTEPNKPLGELTDDWKIISITSTEIKLTDDNPSSAEFLTFTKN